MGSILSCRATTLTHLSSGAETAGTRAVTDGVAWVHLPPPSLWPGDILSPRCVRPSPYFSCGHPDLVLGDSVCLGDDIADHGFRASLEGQPLIVLIVYFCLLWLLWDVALTSPSLVFSCKIRDQGGQVQVGVMITSCHSSLKKSSHHV